MNSVMKEDNSFMFNNVSKNNAHLEEVITSLRIGLDQFLPDHLHKKKNQEQFNHHLAQLKSRLESEQHDWKNGLNYSFETLRIYKEWYAKNQQFIQLQKDEKKLLSHVGEIKHMLSSFVSILQLQQGLREAELHGRVGAYKVMFELSRIAAKLSTPTVELQTMKANESTISIYCDTFVIDIVLDGGRGLIKTASLMTVIKDQSKQYPDRDNDLLDVVKHLALGNSQPFQDKLRRLVRRAELSAKYPTVNFEEKEQKVLEVILSACERMNNWSACRSVDGIMLVFKDKKQLDPLPLNFDSDEAIDQYDSSINETTSKGPKAKTMNNSLKEWKACLCFDDWNGQILSQWVCLTSPLLLSNTSEVKKVIELTYPGTNSDLLMGKLSKWHLDPNSKRALESISHKYTKCTETVNRVYSNTGNQPVVTEGIYKQTRQIPGGYQLNAFPFVTDDFESILQCLQIFESHLLYYSVLHSCFTGLSATFGDKELATGESVNSEMKSSFSVEVEVFSPNEIIMKIDDVYPNDTMLVLKIQIGQITNNVYNGSECNLVDMHFEPASTICKVPLSLEKSQKLLAQCHCLPFFPHFLLHDIVHIEQFDHQLETHHNDTVEDELLSNSNDINFDDAFDDQMKLEDTDVFLDDVVF